MIQLPTGVGVRYMRMGNSYLALLMDVIQLDDDNAGVFAVGNGQTRTDALKLAIIRYNDLPDELKVENNQGLYL